MCFFIVIILSCLPAFFFFIATACLHWLNQSFLSFCFLLKPLLPFVVCPELIPCDEERLGGGRAINRVNHSQKSVIFNSLGLQQ